MYFTESELNIPKLISIVSIKRIANSPRAIGGTCAYVCPRDMSVLGAPCQ